MAGGNVAIFHHSLLISEAGSLFPLSAKYAHELVHAGWLATFEEVRRALIVLNALDLDLTQLDLSKLVLLALTLFNNHPQILLADLPIGVLLVNSVLVLNLAEIAINLINLTLLIIFDFNQVLVYDVNGVGCHLFLLCLVSS